MNETLASYVIEAVFNAQQKPTPAMVRQYLIEPCKDATSFIVIHYRMLDSMTAAITEGRAVDALNIFNLIWWDMNESSAQYMFRLVQDMECDPDDDLSGYTAITLSHTIIDRFPTLT